MSKEEIFVRSACERGFLFFSDHAYEKMRRQQAGKGLVRTHEEADFLMANRNI